MTSNDENEALSVLLNNINDNAKKSVSVEKEFCIAAVKYNTIGSAFKSIKQNLKVYFVKEDKNGTIKTYAYSRCSKTKQDGKDLCHLHCKTNINSLKIFEKDVLPNGNNDKNRYLATVEDDYFENMGKRGAKKKNGENNFIFSVENDPIRLILIHKNPKLTDKLRSYASELLEVNTNIISKDLTSKKSSKNKETSINDVINLITSNEKKLSNLISNSDVTVESDEDDDNQSEEINSNDEDDEVSCTLIYTTKGKQLWLNIDNNIVYEPEGADNGEEIGLLTKISKKHHTIIHEDEYYTVIKEIKDNNDSLINCCVLTDVLFDKDMNVIGKRKKLKNKKYELKIDKRL